MAMPTIKEVRDYILDMPQHNIKFDDEIFTDYQITTAQNWAEERLQIIGPIDGITSGEVPKYAMLVGVIAQLFRMRWINLTMNRAPQMQENGIAIPIGEDSEFYRQMAEQFDQDFTQTVKTYKHNKHIVGAMTSIRSPYNSITRRDRRDPRSFG